MGKSVGLEEYVHDYLLKVGVREDPQLKALREDTAKHPMARMQIAPDQGAFMQTLVRLIGAKNCIEVGTFTGYSALAVAMALPDGGKLVACDISEEFTAIGKPHWAKAAVADKIDLRIAPAAETLQKMLDDDGAGTYDLAFIDADKPSYESYYELCLKLVRTGGLILIDNVLWGGSVADPTNQEPDTVAIRDFNAARQTDERIHLSMIPIADGLTLAVKR